MTISTSQPRGRPGARCRPSSRRPASTPTIETIPHRAVHPAGLHQPREGAGRRRLRRPRVAGAGLPGAVQRHRPDEPRPRSTTRPSRPRSRRSSPRRWTTRSTPTLLQEATKVAVTTMPNTFLYTRAAGDRPGQGRLRAARAPGARDVGRRHGLVSAAVAAVAGRTAAAGAAGPRTDRRVRGSAAAARPAAGHHGHRVPARRRSSPSRWARCRVRTRRPPCSARPRRPRTSPG